MTAHLEDPCRALAEDLVTVELIDLPVAVRRRAAEHHAELEREFALLAMAPHSPVVPQRLVPLGERLRRHSMEFTELVTDLIERAALDGRDAVDVVYSVPRSAGPAAAAFAALLEEADKFCRAERLLTLAPPPEVRAYREWFLGEFVNQCAGARPTPWGAYLRRQPTGRTPVGWMAGQG